MKAIPNLRMKDITIAEWLAQPVKALGTEHFRSIKPTEVLDQGLEHEHAAVNGFYPYADRPEPQPVGMQTGLNDLTGDAHRLKDQVYEEYTPIGVAMFPGYALPDDAPPTQPKTLNHNTAVTYVTKEQFDV